MKVSSQFLLCNLVWRQRIVSKRGQKFFICRSLVSPNYWVIEEGFGNDLAPDSHSNKNNALRHLSYASSRDTAFLSREKCRTVLCPNVPESTQEVTFDRYSPHASISVVHQLTTNRKALWWKWWDHSHQVFARYSPHSYNSTEILATEAVSPAVNFAWKHFCEENKNNGKSDEMKRTNTKHWRATIGKEEANGKFKMKKSGKEPKKGRIQQNVMEENWDSSDAEPVLPKKTVQNEEDTCCVECFEREHSESSWLDKMLEVEKMVSRIL